MFECLSIRFLEWIFSPHLFVLAGWKQVANWCSHLIPGLGVKRYRQQTKPEYISLKTRITKFELPSSSNMSRAALLVTFLL